MLDLYFDVLSLINVKFVFLCCDYVCEYWYCDGLQCNIGKVSCYQYVVQLGEGLWVVVVYCQQIECEVGIVDWFGVVCVGYWFGDQKCVVDW